MKNKDQQLLEEAYEQVQKPSHAERKKMVKDFYNQIEPIANYHFSFIKPLSPGTEICWLKPIEEVGVWTISSNGKWINSRTFENLQAFENQNGKLEEEWRNILFVKGESLVNCYKDGKNYSAHLGYEVNPTKEFYKALHKPIVFDHYYIKDKFERIKKKLPELEGIL